MHPLFHLPQEGLVPILGLSVLFLLRPSALSDRGQQVAVEISAPTFVYKAFCSQHPVRHQ